MISAGPSQSEPVDWLGFSRLGSPDTTLIDAGTAKTAAEKPSATTSAAGKDTGREAQRDRVTIFRPRGFYPYTQWVQLAPSMLHQLKNEGKVLLRV